MLRRPRQHYKTHPGHGQVRVHFSSSELDLQRLCVGDHGHRPDHARDEPKVKVETLALPCCATVALSMVRGASTSSWPTRPSLLLKRAFRCCTIMHLPAGWGEAAASWSRGVTELTWSGHPWCAYTVRHPNLTIRSPSPSLRSPPHSRMSSD